MSEGVFRVQIYTKDYDEINRFYREGLGLEIAGSRETSPDDRVRLYQVASGTIEIIYAPPGSEIPPALGLTLQIEVDDVDSYYEQLIQKGIPIARGLENKFWGHRNFKVHDPNGLELTFYSQIKPKDL